MAGREAFVPTSCSCWTFTSSETSQKNQTLNHVPVSPQLCINESGFSLRSVLKKVITWEAAIDLTRLRTSRHIPFEQLNGGTLQVHAVYDSLILLSSKYAPYSFVKVQSKQKPGLVPLPYSLPICEVLYKPSSLLDTDLVWLLFVIAGQPFQASLPHFSGAVLMICAFLFPSSLLVIFLKQDSSFHSLT